MFGFGKSKAAPEEIGVALLGLVFPPEPGFDDKALETIGAHRPEDVSRVNTELFLLRLAGAKYAAERYLPGLTGERALGALWVFLAERAGTADAVEDVKQEIGGYEDAAFQFGGVEEAHQHLIREAGKVFAQRCGRLMDPVVSAVGAMCYGITVKLAKEYFDSVKIVESEGARHAVDELKRKQQRR